MNTLCLCMIVKNENNILYKCLDSIVKYIDYWIISDTGSTDGTQEFIKKYFKEHNIPGELHEDKWVNFGYNRSQVFEKARESKNQDKFTHYLVIDADDKLYGDLTDFKNTIDNGNNRYYINIHHSNIEFKREQIFNKKFVWKYVGVLHEYPCSENDSLESIVINNCYIQDGRCSFRNTSTTIKEKYLNDAKILLQGIIDEPQNNRYYFYLANSYRDAEEYDLAIEYYNKRVEMGGWEEEVYYSLYCIGMCKENKKCNFENDILYCYLKAYNYRNTRLEALFKIVNYYRLNGKYKEGYSYGLLGYKNIYPQDILFVDRGIHNYKLLDELAICSYYVNEHQLAIKLNNQIVKMYETSLIKIDIDRIKKNINLSHNYLNNYMGNNEKLYLQSNLNTLCIYTGYSDIEYNGSNYSQQKVRGSEIATIKLAEELSNYLTVFVCGHNILLGEYNNVHYGGVEIMNNLLQRNIIDIMIISRYAHFFCEYNNTSKLTYLWLHDIIPSPWIHGATINSYNLLKNVKNLDKVLCLSNWHKSYNIEQGILKENIEIIGNGTDIDIDISNIKNKYNNRFIYISTASRSLIEVVDVFNIIIEKQPEKNYQLHVYCDASDIEELSINLFTEMKNNSNIFINGKTSHKNILEQLQLSTVWLYIPSSFEETYCISAIEAQYAKCLCFVNNIGSLAEVVDNRGYIFEVTDTNEHRANIILEKIKNKEYIDEKNELIDEWISKQTWKHRAQQWIKMFGL